MDPATDGMSSKTRTWSGGIQPLMPPCCAVPVRPGCAASGSFLTASLRIVASGRRQDFPPRGRRTKAGNRSTSAGRRTTCRNERSPSQSAWMRLPWRWRIGVVRRACPSARWAAVGSWGSHAKSLPEWGRMCSRRCRPGSCCRSRPSGRRSALTTGRSGAPATSGSSQRSA